jgi:RecA/RadA recombinase
MVNDNVPSGTIPSSSRKNLRLAESETMLILSALDRLPTVSASYALRQLRNAGTRTIATNLPTLDRILVGQALATYGHGGLVRGQLTEVFGPPGSGKTAFWYIHG